MSPNPAFWSGRPVGVTGGSGFLGWHLVGQLAALGARVCVFGPLPARGHPLLDRAAIELVPGDLADTVALRRALAGRSIIFHVAGLVAGSGPALRRMHAVNVEGTRNVLAAAGAARVVHTSSVVAVGASADGRPLDEDSPFNLDGVDFPYAHSKREAERVALGSGQDVVVVNPGYLIGPEDHTRSVMGRFCKRFWRGRLPVTLPGGLNLVDVRDAARGHVLAAERGAAGRRYILGGENFPLADFMRLLARVAGFRPRALPMLSLAALRALAWLGAWKSRGDRPAWPAPEHAVLFRYHWYYRSDRAARELGFTARPVVTSLREAYAWMQRGKPHVPRGLNRWLLRPAG